ncbi:NADH:ubiquinone reductase (Na(+)-transporting) subunit C [Verrucomicrobiota bacterium]
MGKELKTIGFAAIICLVCSLLLAAVYSGLKSEQDRNKVVDMKVKVLTAFGVDISDDKGRITKTSKEIEEIFDAQVKGEVLDNNGNLVDLSVGSLTEEQINTRDEDGLKQYYPLYTYTDLNSGRKLYGIHVSGKGLWSLIKGYLAMEDDLFTIAGIAFYEHQETPGLGGEIEKDFFQNGFKGKTFIENGVVKEFRVIKPGTKGDDHCVDGITAATMTCKGVANFLNSDFAVYNKYFEKSRKLK